MIKNASLLKKEKDPRKSEKILINREFFGISSQEILIDVPKEKIFFCLVKLIITIENTCILFCLMSNIVKYLTSSDVNYMPKLSACAFFAQGFSTIFLTGFTKNGLTLKTLWPNPSHAPYLDEYSSQKCLLAEG